MISTNSSALLVEDNIHNGEGTLMIKYIDEVSKPKTGSRGNIYKQVRKGYNG